ncbi:MAG: hypothetical protein IT228_04040 [Flavobacteriales bacterium]|nr:hypothetical protein [Flavobacteriales bacterium]MCC6576493.1 hypothetical protein [Flavobacteriales bacterium]
MVVLLLPWAAVAQDKGLTAEFSRLSAKERSRLAKEESEAARKDTAFQATMARAEAHFQARRYEAAVADFEKARAMRPLNVYPPVKLDDLRVLIAKRDAADRQRKADSVARAAPVVPVPAPEPPAVREVPVPAAEPPVAPAAPAPPTAAPEVREAPPRPVDTPVVQKAPPLPAADPPARPAPRTVVRTAPPDSVPSMPPSREPGVHEEQFKEGNALVLQRTVTTATEVHVYRKVTHPWGGVFHFLDGLPVDERAWTERFGDR